MAADGVPGTNDYVPQRSYIKFVSCQVLYCIVIYALCLCVSVCVASKSFVFLEGQLMKMSIGKRIKHTLFLFCFFSFHLAVLFCAIFDAEDARIF